VPLNVRAFKDYGLILVVCVIASLMLLGSLRWIPPLQSPDENAHLARAYAISQGDWQLESPPGKTSGISIDSNLAQFMHGYLENIHIPGFRLSQEAQSTLNHLHWGSERIFFPAPGTGYYNPLIYVPHASAWWLGEHLDLTIAQSYTLVRISCFVVSLLLLVLAYRLFMPNLVVSGLILLPMTLFQMLMPTIDGICHGLLVLILSWYCALQQSNPQSGSAENYWQKEWFLIGTFCVLIFFLSSARLHALPLVLLILFLPNHFSWPQKVIGFSLTLAAIAIWILYASTSVVDLRIARALSNTQVLQFYMDHPYRWWQLLSATLSSATQWYSYTMMFIGVLGWLHVQLPIWYYSWCAAIFLILLFMALRMDLPRWQPWNFFHFGLIAFCSIAVMFQALLITWTPITSPTIEGIQGRYFWIPACILAFAIRGGQPYGKFGWVFLLGLLILNTSIILHAYARYYY
jgi:hypothetical protein